MELKEPTATTHTLDDGRQLQTRVYIPGKVATVEGVFDKAECSAIIAAGKKNGFNTNDDENALDQRMRYEWYDEKFAQRLFVAIRHVLKDQLSDGRVPTRVRDKLRLYRYEVGDSFRPHVDGGYTYRTGPLLGESAVYTFVLFLNDASSGLEGGATRFCDVQSKGWPADAPNAITPEIGKVLVFQQKHMVHEGGEVQKGTKFIIQGMVMYSRPVGTAALPAANIFEQVVCKDDEDQSELSAALNEKVQWRPSCPTMEEINAHERLVRMAKAGLPEAAIVETLKRHGVPQTQIDVYLPKILLEAKERINKEEATSEEEEEDRTNTGGGDLVPHKKGSLKDTVYYSMLKAGHDPSVVRQRMVVLGKIEPVSADRLIQLLVDAVKEEGDSSNYDY